jgi:hypothetical protein
MLHVCESRTSHVLIDRFVFCSDLFARISFHVRKWIQKKRKRNIFIIELCESYDASNKRQTRDELVVMTRANDRERKMFFNWKKTFFAYDDVTILLFLRFSFSKNLLWIISCDDKNVLRSRVVCATLIDNVLFMLLWNDLNIALLTLIFSVKNIREMLTLICWCFIFEKCEWNCEKRAFR